MAAQLPHFLSVPVLIVPCGGIKPPLFTRAPAVIVPSHGTIEAQRNYYRGNNCAILWHDREKLAVFRFGNHDRGNRGECAILPLAQFEASLLPILHVT